MARLRRARGARRPGVALGSVFALAALAAFIDCTSRGAGNRAETADASSPAPSTSATPWLDALLRRQRLSNPIAYIPPQCFTKTRDAASGAPRNPCYPCHVRSEPPNYADDGDLQVTLKLPAAAAKNPWDNLFHPPLADARRMDDGEVLRYVRKSNYFDGDGKITLARVLGDPPREWDTSGNGVWDGFTPDVWFVFDDRGFDHRPDGSTTGWRAFAYYPFPGTFFPTNGSTDDVLIRLSPVLQEDSQGRYDQRIYELNLAIVEALATRSDVPIDPVDEAPLGVDLDLNGRLGRASRVAFDAGSGRGATRMHYVGRAHEVEQEGRFWIAPGLFPVGTEFFHTVRYLDVSDDGVVALAPRMKEVRYAKKVQFLNYDQLRTRADTEAREQANSHDGSHVVYWEGERGVGNGQGWLYQGFIEDADGALRPQSREEATFCAGCHGGIGATTDGIFSLPRKLGAGAPARGWFHWSQHDLRGLPEPRRSDGPYEYTLYLREAGAGDELRENAEVRGIFFDEHGELRPAEVARLHDDIAHLLLPTSGRALDLDRAYAAIVDSQSFSLGRDSVLAVSQNVYSAPPIAQPTGVRAPVGPARLRTVVRAARGIAPSSRP